MRKPFWKSSHAAWYVQIGSKQVRLGTDKAEAEAEYHRLMAGQTPVDGRTSVVVLLDQFLGWTDENRSPRTFGWYHNHLRKFAQFIGARLRVSEIKPYHVTRWLATMNGGDTYKNGAARAVSRAFSWARRQRLIPANPIEGMERPASELREVYVSPEQWSRAIALVKESDPFADLLWFLRETGCRPMEARVVEARHWHDDRITLELKDSKGRKGRKTRRVIRLNTRALEIVRRRALKHPEGPLFVNTKGRPWTAFSMNCRFRTMAKKLDFE